MTTLPVVVGVDGSEESLRAVEWAADEARRRGAPLRIVSAPAMPPRMHASHGDTRMMTRILRGMSASALGEAVTRTGEIAPDVLVDTDLLSGSPAVAVMDSGAGGLMLVLGARGSGGFAPMLLGSVSRYAAMHASCPVVVVRNEASAVHREIAVGVRDAREASRTLGFAFDEAARRAATLVVIHAWHWFPSVLRGPGRLEDLPGQPFDSERISAAAGEDLADALAGWREKFPGVTVRQDVLRGHPARMLASYSARADLVVIGRHGAGSAVGGVQHALLNHAHGAVAVIPGDD